MVLSFVGLQPLTGFVQAAIAVCLSLILVIFIFDSNSLLKKSCCSALSTFIMGL